MKLFYLLLAVSAVSAVPLQQSTDLYCHVCDEAVDNSGCDNTQVCDSNSLCHTTVIYEDDQLYISKQCSPAQICEDAQNDNVQGCYSADDEFQGACSFCCDTPGCNQDLPTFQVNATAVTQTDYEDDDEESPLKEARSKAHPSRERTPKPPSRERPSRERTPKPPSRERPSKEHTPKPPSKERPSREHPSKENTPRPHTPRPHTPRPHTPKPPSKERPSREHPSKEQTPRPHTPRPNTPKPHTSRPNTPRPTRPATPEPTRAPEPVPTKGHNPLCKVHPGNGINIAINGIGSIAINGNNDNGNGCGSNGCNQGGNNGGVQVNNGGKNVSSLMFPQLIINIQVNAGRGPQCTCGQKQQTTPAPTTPEPTEPTPKPTTEKPGNECYTCADVYCMNQEMITCPSERPLCMNVISQNDDGERTFHKQCVSEETCRTDWWEGTAGLADCFLLSDDPMGPPGMVLDECAFCCKGNGCNRRAIPDMTSVWQPSA